MVESRVVVRNAAGVHGDVRVAVALDGLIGLAPQTAAGPSALGGVSRGVVHVADTVEAWLKLWIGDRSQTVVEPIGVRSTR